MKHNDDENQAEDRLEHFVDAPGAVAKHGEADDHGDGGRGQLGENGHRERRALPGYAELGLYQLFERVDVVLKVAREELARFLVHAVHVGDQRQQAEQKNQGDAAPITRASFLLAGMAGCGRSINPTGRFSSRRSFCSRRAIWPWSHSWS